MLWKQYGCAAEAQQLGNSQPPRKDLCGARGGGSVCSADGLLGLSQCTKVFEHGSILRAASPHDEALAAK
jgi:hypothetical protein